MNSKLLAIFIIITLVFSAGCTVKVGPQKEADSNVSTEAAAPIEAEEETVEPETEEPEPAETVDCGPYWLQYKEHLKSGFSEKASVALTHECVKTYISTGQETVTTPSPSTPATAVDSEDEVLAYLKENPVAQFEGISDRILKVTTTGTSAKLTYRTSTTDPSQESAYLCGVLLVQFPDVDTVDVTGYNHEDKEMEASIKHFTRRKYNFNNYKLWFPDYEYNECTEDSECNDNDECTRDFCKDKKCYNSKLVNSACPS